MVGAFSVVGSSVMETHTCPCLCFDAMPTTNLKLKIRGGFVLRKNSKNNSANPGSLSSSFVDTGLDRRLSRRLVNRNLRKQRRKPAIVNELAGQYDEGFDDVKTQILNYFTYKGIRTVMNQLYEMNPTQYRWFYDFVASNKPEDGKSFMRTLVKEKRDLAERVMITRLHLYGKWIKKCNHAQIYKEISDENLELMRERLRETVIWPSDDRNTETETIR